MSRDICRALLLIAVTLTLRYGSWHIRHRDMSRCFAAALASAVLSYNHVLALHFDVGNDIYAALSLFWPSISWDEWADLAGTVLVFLLSLSLVYGSISWAGLLILTVPNVRIKKWYFGSHCRPSCSRLKVSVWFSLSLLFVLKSGLGSALSSSYIQRFNLGEREYFGNEVACRFLPHLSPFVACSCRRAAPYRDIAFT